MREYLKYQGGQLLRGTARGWPLASLYIHPPAQTSTRTEMGKKGWEGGKTRRDGEGKEREGRKGWQKIKITSGAGGIAQRLLACTHAHTGTHACVHTN